MVDPATDPQSLDLPRNESQLATTSAATEQLRELFGSFLGERLADADADQVVLALDGEIGSTVSAALAVEALGPERVTALIMPVQLTDEASARLAEEIADGLNIDHHRLQLQPLIIEFQSLIGVTGEPTDDIVAMGNVSERFRMACLYYVANTTNALVLGSADRTARLLGSVTKHGETGVDVALLADLYLSEVLALAEDLELPEPLLARSRRRTKHGEATDTELLDVTAETLDRILRLAVDEERDDAAVAEQLGVDQSIVERVRGWCVETRHKRDHPLTLSTSV